MRTDEQKADDEHFVEGIMKQLSDRFNFDNIVIVANKGDKVAFHYNKNDKDKMKRILLLSTSYLMEKN